VAHVKQQIREYIVTKLTGLTTCGANVYDSRVYPYDVTPCMSVYGGEDHILEPETLGQRQRREFMVIVEARVKPEEGGSSVEDQLDDICKEVEAQIATYRKLGGLAEVAEYAGATRPELLDGVERPVGLIEITFRVVYRIIATAPDTAIPV